MAAALASVKGNSNIQNQINSKGAILPAGIARPKQNELGEP